MAIIIIHYVIKSNTYRKCSKYKSGIKHSKIKYKKHEKTKKLWLYILEDHRNKNSIVLLLTVEKNNII